MPMPRVLIADDEAHITCVVAGRLQAAGFLVVTARDGEEAFELACQHNPALVVTDLQMPRMSGLDLAAKLKAHGPTSSTPVIMLTARGYVLDEAELKRTNVRCVMNKPFSARELVRKVSDMLAMEGPADATPAPPAREAA